MRTITDYTRAAAISGFLAVAPTTGMAQELTAAEVVALHAGKCVSYRGPSRGTQCFGADGSTNYNDRSYGRDTGRWEMRGNEMCVAWNKEPEWDCGPIWRVDANTFSDGEYSWTIN